MQSSFEIEEETAAQVIPGVLHGFAVMDRTGDTKITWDPRNADEVEHARKTFNDLLKKNFTAFTVNPKDASKNVQVREFNPNEAMYIFVPQYQGG